MAGIGLARWQDATATEAGVPPVAFAGINFMF